MYRKRKSIGDEFVNLILVLIVLSVLGIYFRYKEFWDDYGYLVFGGLFFIVLFIYIYIAHGYILSKHSKATWYALKLERALNRNGVKTEIEYYDGHKHVDISLLEANINIEVDGMQHYIKAKQIEADFRRIRGSIKNGEDTIHIPNVLVKTHRRKIARAIAEVVEKRISR